ncbi:MAG: hypothetical protein WAU61_03530 [Smithella sp.]
MELIFFCSLIVLVIIGYAMHNNFLNILKEKYPAIWSSLGSPTLFANNTPQNGLAVQKYIFKKDYKTLDDKKFISFCDSLRMFGIFYLCYFIAGIIFFLVSSI